MGESCGNPIRLWFCWMSNCGGSARVNFFLKLSRLFLLVVWDDIRGGGGGRDGSDEHCACGRGEVHCGGGGGSDVPSGGKVCSSVENGVEVHFDGGGGGIICCGEDGVVIHCDGGGGGISCCCDGCVVVVC